jgi:hypothetical protein
MRHPARAIVTREASGSRLIASMSPLTSPMRTMPSKYGASLSYRPRPEQRAVRATRRDLKLLGCADAVEFNGCPSIGHDCSVELSMTKR